MVIVYVLYLNGIVFGDVWFDVCMLLCVWMLNCDGFVFDLRLGKL